jgi:nucleotide-binding universal stress UspA family protein
MRVYLVIMDATDEARVALRFASRRAVKTDGAVHILALAPQPDFVAFGGIQATMEAEARQNAQDLAEQAASDLAAQGAAAPLIAVRQGEGVKVIREYLAQHPEVAALVLGAAPDGDPGPLVAHYSQASGQLACPVFIVPGGLSDSELDRLS